MSEHTREAGFACAALIDSWAEHLGAEARVLRGLAAPTCCHMHAVGILMNLSAAIRLADGHPTPLECPACGSAHFGRCSVMGAPPIAPYVAPASVESIPSAEADRETASLNLIDPEGALDNEREALTDIDRWAAARRICGCWACAHGPMDSQCSVRARAFAALRAPAPPTPPPHES